MTITFFADRNIGTDLPRRLTEGGLNIEIHDDHFGPKAADEVWLPSVAKRGWVALSFDYRIYHRSSGSPSPQ